jgi:hypothetical protein
VGKPLPELPGALWWNVASRKWEEGQRGWARFAGKVTVVFSFDDCPTCKEARLRKLSQMQRIVVSTAPKAPLDMVGIFFDERPGRSGKEANLKSAEALFDEIPPSFPTGVAFYPGGEVPGEALSSQVIIHQHGTAILDTKGLVTFIQIVGVPEREFFEAYQKALQQTGAWPPPSAKGEPRGEAKGEAKGQVTGDAKDAGKTEEEAGGRADGSGSPSGK